jgi:hypothetical protein
LFLHDLHRYTYSTHEDLQDLKKNKYMKNALRSWKVFAVKKSLNRRLIWAKRDAYDDNSMGNMKLEINGKIREISPVCNVYELIHLNTGIAGAQDPVAMAEAMNFAVKAGRIAFKAGRIPKKLYASASSPLEGISR